MFKKRAQETEANQMPQPTSPWTESFQAAPPHEAEPQDDACMPRSFDNDDQRPTHDALSDIYNSGYEV